MSVPEPVAGIPPAWLQTQVCELRRRTRRRVFATVLDLVYTGPGSTRTILACEIPTGDQLDHALRVDLLVGLLAGLAEYGHRTNLLVTRSGPGPAGGTDRGWHAAWTVAGGILGRPPGTTAVVTRYGYGDVAAGWWVRVEPRRHRR